MLGIAASSSADAECLPFQFHKSFLKITIAKLIIHASFHQVNTRQPCKVVKMNSTSSVIGR